ncbi:hypothetical protein [Cryobacterium sp. Y57]|uniref:hypothetical protein n=1 Tax=Cryobacterium sp. Y57 TaxID=2048287 RepID=UPI000CE34E2E|nr:hypothetical protein [Cryobacterium sp. Y57]
MSKPINQKTYTIKTAARRVKRSEWTIKQWMRDGMPRRMVAGVVVIEHDDLMVRYRANIMGNRTRAADAPETV